MEDGAETSGEARLQESDPVRDAQISAAYSEIFSAPVQSLLLGGGGTGIRKIEEIFPDPFRVPSSEEESESSKVSGISLSSLIN